MSQAASDRDTVLLAATVAFLMAEEQAATQPSGGALSWSQAGRVPRLRVAWNPRGSEGWRMTGRLEAQKAYNRP